MRAACGWGLVFVGANQDTAETARNYGMHEPGAAFDFDSAPQSVSASLRTVRTAA